MGKVAAYFREALFELKKVTWPTRKQTTLFSIIVIVLTIVVAIFFGILDYIFNWMLGIIV